MTPDTPVCIFSASKAMAAMPLHSETVVLSDDSSFAPSVLLEGGT